MYDAGQAETEKILRKIERDITKEYQQAENEIQTKLEDYLRRFRIKDELKRKALDNGLITQKEYNEWRIGQIMIGKRWAEMRDAIAYDLANASQMARNIAFSQAGNVYAVNFNYGTYQVEKGARLDTSFTLYDMNSVEQLYRNGETFIPSPGRKVQQAINEGKQVAWDKKQVQSVMMQGILQGKSIPDLASSLAHTVGESDRKAAIRNARTLVTGVQNAGRMASYDRANGLGIETQKMWLATFDQRTRHWHAELDRVSVDNDQPFHNDYGDIMYPGDPSADPANIFNCRCTLTANIKGFERDNPNKDLVYKDDLGEMSYDEWKAGHYEQKSNPITNQEEISENMKNAYDAEYRTYNNLTNSGKDDTINKRETLRKISNVSTGKKRNEKPLTEQEITELTKYARTLGFKNDIQYSDYSNTGFVSGYLLGERYCRLVIGTDVKPVEVVSKGMKANQILSSKAAIAHEIVGHYEAWLNGFVCSEKSLEEAQASIRAARFAEGLTKEDRYMLIRDGLNRLKEDGVSLSEARKHMKIESR